MRSDYLAEQMGRVGILASLLVKIASEYTSAIALVYLLSSSCNFQLKYPSSMSKYLDMDSGYLSGVGQVNILSCSTFTKIFLKTFYNQCIISIPF